MEVARRPAEIRPDTLAGPSVAAESAAKMKLSDCMPEATARPASASSIRSRSHRVLTELGEVWH